MFRPRSAYCFLTSLISLTKWWTPSSPRSISSSDESELSEPDTSTVAFSTRPWRLCAPSLASTFLSSRLFSRSRHSFSISRALNAGRPIRDLLITLSSSALRTDDGNTLRMFPSTRTSMLVLLAASSRWSLHAILAINRIRSMNSGRPSPSFLAMLLHLTRASSGVQSSPYLISSC